MIEESPRPPPHSLAPLGTDPPLGGRTQGGHGTQPTAPAVPAAPTAPSAPAAPGNPNHVPPSRARLIAAGIRGRPRMGRQGPRSRVSEEEHNQNATPEAPTQRIHETSPAALPGGPRLVRITGANCEGARQLVMNKIREINNGHLGQHNKEPEVLADTTHVSYTSSTNPSLDHLPLPLTPLPPLPPHKPSTPVCAQLGARDSPVPDNPNHVPIHQPTSTAPTALTTPTAPNTTPASPPKKKRLRKTGNQRAKACQEALDNPLVGGSL